MKMFIVFAVVIAAAMAAAIDQETTVLRLENEVNEDGYQFAYDTSDGTSRQEKGSLKNFGQDADAVVVEGTISWTAPNGEKFALRYVADETGYHPEGTHLPTL